MFDVPSSTVPRVGGLVSIVTMGGRGREREWMSE